MDKTQALQNLLNGTASEEDINLLKGGLASGEISIGGNVNQSVIIIGSGNTVELPPAALDRLGGRSLLGDLDRDLTGDEIIVGLNRLEAELPLRAPVLQTQFQEQTRRLRPSLKTNAKSLSDQAHRERVEALAQINSLCMEALDISFNALCIGEEPPEYDSRSPFRGLESFRPEDSEFFFGRESLIKKLVGKINSHPFLAVLGASGSGKSSLVMAGLIPALDSEYIIFRPGANPLEALEAAKENDLVVVDQFEELFTLTRDEATRKEFISKLLETIKRNKVIITLRSDFLGEVGAYRLLKEEIQSHLEIVPPMDMDELHRSMEGQANQVGLRFEADLSQQILDDVEGEPGAMPLLQHALWELWNRRHGRNLCASEYRAFGGVKQAITSTAEKVYGECAKEEKEQIRDIFLRLTRLDDSDEGRDTRRRVAMNDLIPSGRDTDSTTLLLDKLANARLIVKTVNEDKTEIEVAHEALIRHWERLRTWLNEDRENLRLRESASEDARRWENAGRDEILLNHRGGRLDDALSLGENSRYGLTEIEQAYLKACISLRNKEQREREKRLRYAVFASIAAAVIFLVLGSFGLIKSNEATAQAGTAQANADVASIAQANADNQAHAAATAQFQAEIEKQKAEQQAKTARAGELAAQAAFLREEKFSTSMLLAIQAFNIQDNFRTRAALFDSVSSNPGFKYYLKSPFDWVTSVMVSPDGKTIAFTKQGNDVILLDTETGRSINRFNISGGAVNVEYLPHPHWDITAFSPDGKLLATVSGAGTIILWNIGTGEPVLNPIPGNTYFTISVTFSPDSQILAISGCGKVAPEGGCAEGEIILREVATGKLIGQPMLGHSSIITSTAFSPDSKVLASGSQDGSLILWDVESNQQIGNQLKEQSEEITSVAFSTDGKILASGSLDNTIMLWDIQTQLTITSPLRGHLGGIRRVIFSPNSEILVSASDDRSVLLWDLKTLRPIGDPLKVHSDTVFSLWFSQDGKTLISGSDDGTVAVWCMEQHYPIEQEITEKSNYLADVAISPDGKTLAFSGYNNILTLWDLEAQQPIEKTFKGHTNGIVAIAFNPDGTILASADWDQNIILWDIKTGEIIFTFKEHTDFVTGLVFSPDGKTLASSSYDGKIILWDVKTGMPIGDPITENYSDLIVDIDSIAFSPDGKFLASGIGYSIRLWDVSTRRDRRFINGHVSSIWSIAFSPDGKFMASGGSDNVIALWDVSADDGTVEPVGERIKGLPNIVTKVVFSPDGQLLASGDESGNVMLWDVQTRQLIGQSLKGHSKSVSGLVFSPNGETLISGSFDNTISLWNLNPQFWIRNSCLRANRDLTNAEWALYFPGEEYQTLCDQLLAAEVP